MAEGPAARNMDRADAYLKRHDPGTDVHLHPEQAFTFDRNRCSRWAGIRIRQKPQPSRNSRSWPQTVESPVFWAVPEVARAPEQPGLPRETPEESSHPNRLLYPRAGARWDGNSLVCNQLGHAL